MRELSYLQVKNPKEDETPIEAATQIFASILPYPYVPRWKRLYVKPKTVSFEIYLTNQTIYFYIVTQQENETLVSSLISSSFPTSIMLKTPDPMDEILKSKNVKGGEMVLNSYTYLPIKTYFDFKDIDPLSSLIGFLAKQDKDVKMAVQIMVTPAYSNWQDKVLDAAKALAHDLTADKYAQNPQKLLIMRKASFQGGKAIIRVIVGTDGKPPMPYLKNLAGTFGSFSMGEGNQFVFKRPLIVKSKILQRAKERTMSALRRNDQILNAQELASLWHPPGYLLSGIKNIAWGKTLLGEPPENLPISPSVALAKDGSTILSEEESADAKAMADKEKKDVNFFAKTEFKNEDSIFGIKTEDRRKHVYIIGKTGVGKSTLIANMAIDDIRKGRGIGVIDPHGDLSEILLEYIPNRRINDVVYLEPFDTERPFSLNVLDISNMQQKDLVASGIVSIFHKIYRDSWGPRLEYILRNVILTLLEIPDGTLVDVLKLLSDDIYRRKAVSGLSDQVIKDFWEKEFARMPDSLRAEAVSPIQNKVGQFVSSKMIRNIIGTPKSSIHLGEIMDQGKILILNLSQGKLGEDSAALLGAMFITQIQLAAMNRSFVKEDERKDFFLYVDEFQNFATESFIKILSEARKYRLSLTLANQYIEQLDLPVQKAIFGNVGTLASFVVGASDAKILTSEYAEIYSENDLVSIGKHEIVLKLSIDGMTSGPFPAKTLPLPALKNENKEKIIRYSKERYGRKV